MKYSIKEMSEMAGVSARTLRYYDEIDLLKPSSVTESGYRYYGEREVMLLQQILFYRERGLELGSIKKIIYEEDFDILQALEEHLQELQHRKNHVEKMIEVLTQTISSMKGETTMSNKEKFAAFKEKAVEENEQKYGNEIREKYGDSAVDESNRKILHMSQEQWEEFQQLEMEIKELLKMCVEHNSSVDNESAKKIVEKHKKWLMMTWKQYSVDAHKGLAAMYVADERFTAYYDEEVKGCAEFLKKAIIYWADKLE